MGFAFGEKKSQNKTIHMPKKHNKSVLPRNLFFLFFFSGCMTIYFASVTGGYVGQHGGYKRKDHSDSSGDNGPLLM